MEGAKDCPVIGELFAKGADALEELGFGDFTEGFLAKQRCHGFHFPRDGGVVVCQIGVVAACGGDDKVVSVIGEVDFDGGDDGVLRVFEVDSYNAAVCTCNLVHKAAGFSEVDVFGFLAHDGKIGCGESVIVVKVVENRAQKDLDRCRAAQARALEDSGADVGLKAADIAATLYYCSGNAFYQGICGSEKRLLGGEVRKVHFYCHVAFAVEDDFVVLGGMDRGYGVQVDGSCYDLSEIVVCMVSAELSPACCREDCLRLCPEELLMLLLQVLKASFHELCVCEFSVQSSYIHRRFS